MHDPIAYLSENPILWKLLRMLERNSATTAEKAISLAPLVAQTIAESQAEELLRDTIFLAGKYDLTAVAEDGLTWITTEGVKQLELRDNFTRGSKRTSEVLKGLLPKIRYAKLISEEPTP